MTLRTITVVALLAAATVSTSPATHAGVPTCHGKPATIVGVPGQRVFGTDGPDVIVSNGARGVSAFLGADTICVTGKAARVNAGFGDDWVRARFATTTFLGAGNDSYIGSDAPDRVYDDKYGKPEGRDTISTAGGTDSVSSGSGSGGSVRDSVDLGAGDDGLDAGYATEAPASTPASYAGGPGSDQLNTPASHAPSYDVSAGTAITDGVTRFLFAGFETYTLAQGTGSLSFLGTDEPETLYLLENAATVGTAGGNDVVVVRAPRPGISWPTLDLGAGVDRLFMGGGELQDGAFDLATGELVNSGQAHSALGVEDLFTSNWQSFSVLGTDGPDRIQLEWVCEPSVDARGGDDVVMVDARYEGCPHVIHGGDGDDVLTGGPLGDQLYGDGGYDTVHGRGGADICEAEVVDCPA
jgi:hypothetical protein